MSIGTAVPYLEEHSFERSPLKRVGTTSGRIGWQNLRSDEFTTEGPYLVTGMHFNNRGGVDWERCFHITTDRWVMAPEIQLRPQDILFTKDGSIGKVAFVDDLPGPAALNSHLLVIRPRRSAFVPRFLFYVLNSQLLSDYVEVEKRGTTFSGITEESVDQFPVPLPPPPTQRLIADYLDAETARIDALIAKKRRMIELLDLRIRAAISSVTEVGEPVRVRHVTSLRTSGPRGWANLVRDDGEPFIRSANLRRDDIDLRSRAGVGPLLVVRLSCVSRRSDRPRTSAPSGIAPDPALS
jgi:type I restriction enzyme S subunit